jgi:hypothetical protein
MSCSTDFIFPSISAETFMGLFATTLPLIFLCLALFLMHAQSLGLQVLRHLGFVQHPTELLF